MSSPTKPGFTPGKPTVYTPKKKPAPAAGATTTQPDRERDRSIGTRLDAPPETDLASDPNNRGLPVDLTTGKSVSEEDTKEMIVDATDPDSTSKHPGEDRHSQTG